MKSTQHRDNRSGTFTSSFEIQEMLIADMLKTRCQAHIQESQASCVESAYRGGKLQRQMRRIGLKKLGSRRVPRYRR